MSEKKVPFRIVIHGRGGHGSRPFNCINPVDCFAALYGALKAEADMRKAGSLRVTAVDAGSKANTIRDDLSFCGEFSCDAPEQADRLSARLPEILEAVCAAYRCRGELLSPEGAV